MSMARPKKDQSQQTAVQSSTNPSDPLLECFGYILSLYGLQPDLQAMLSALPRAQNSMIQPHDLEMLAKELSINIQIRRMGFSGLPSLNTPAILLLRGQKAQVMLPSETHKGEVFVPGQGLVKQNSETLRDEYYGHIITIAPPGAKTRHIEHMWQPKAIDWFWKPVLSYWPQYAEIILCSFFINLFAVAMPLFTMNVYDRVVPNFATDTLYVLAIGIVIAFTFDFLFKTVRAYILEKVAAQVSARFDRDLMAKFMDLAYEDIGLSVGAKTNIFRELHSIRDFYSTRLVPAIVDVPFFIFFLLIIDLIAPTVVWVPALGAAVIVALTIFVQVPINRLTRKYFSDMQAKSGHMVETLAGLETTRLFGAQGNALFRWQDKTSRAAQSARQNQFLLSVAGNFSTTVMMLVNVFVVFTGVFAIHAGELSIGGLIAVTILSSRAMAPIMNIAGVVSKMKQSRDALQMVDKLFQIPVPGQDGKPKGAKGPFTGNIQLKNVSYHYKDQSLPALDTVSLSIKAGEKIGLIGQTGAGKSTLAKIIAGLLQPETGNLLYDGFSHDTIHPDELRRYIGVVPQQSFFFNSSIRDNIMLGAHDISDENFRQATELSGLNMYIEQTGQGFDSEVGEDGRFLSGGQKQAIALARAIVRNPQILIFDEPTTGMDQALEQWVRSKLTPYLEDKTFIMVTHRTGLLSLINRLVLLNKGQIAADGQRDKVLEQLGGAKPESTTNARI